MLVLLLGLLAFSIFSLVPYNAKDYYPNSIIVCLNKQAVGNTQGKLDYTFERGILTTKIPSINVIAKKYQLDGIEQLYWVKDQNWCDTNGAYPMNTFRIKIRDNAQIENAIVALQKDKNVVYADYESILRLSYTPNDPMLSTQWAISKIMCPQVWDYVRGDTTVVIGIVDSGVKWNHPDLRANIHINQAELPGITINWAAGTITGGDGIDNDGNGKVDDVLGWDFKPTTAATGADNNPYQNYGTNNHGTHCAGCAAAVGDNGVGVCGPAMHVKIMPVKCAPSNQSVESVYNGYNGIYYCADSAVPIISCSWGGPGGGPQANTVINYAYNHGSIVLCAASNDNTDNGVTHYYPSDCDNAISVAATDQSDNRASFSNYGTPIDVCSPGVGIRSTIYTPTGTDAYDFFDGTSMATPIAAGVCALIKSANPTFTASQIKQRLMDSCDPIDELNPDYVGKLGSGRVNAFAAVMIDKIPNLSLLSVTASENGGDNDGIINPGEPVSAVVSISNAIGWLDATGISGTVSCTDPNVTMTSSQINFTDAPGGMDVTSTNAFSFTTTANLNSLMIPFNLHIASNQQNEYPYAKDVSFSITLSLEQAGWPVANTGVPAVAPIICDIDHDGLREVLFTDSQGKLNAVKPNGTQVANYPKAFASTLTVCPAVADINSDGAYEIVFPSGNTVYVVKANADTLFTFLADGQIKKNAIIADLNNDNSKEIIFSTIGSATVGAKIYVLTATGQLYPNFPVTLTGPSMTPMAVGDIDGDQIRDIVSVTTNGTISVNSGATGAVLSGWPQTINGGSEHGCIIANVDSDPQPEIICASKLSSNAPVTVYNQDGSINGTYMVAQAVKTSPIVADVNNDGVNEVVFVSNNGNIYALNSQVQPITGYPIVVATNPTVESSPIVAKFDFNENFYYLFGDNNGYLHAINAMNDHAEAPNFPVYLGSAIKQSPSIQNVDTDSNVEIAVANQQAMNLLDYKHSLVGSTWNDYRCNIARTACLMDGTTDNHDQNTTVVPTTLYRNYPNPFNPTTTISFNLKEASSATLAIYNVKGQLVRTLVNGHLTEGVHNILWNGQDDKGKTVSSGIYFYRLSNKNFTSVQKMIMMK